MRIRRTDNQEAPDINLIPLIDVLLVIVIFLVVTTTFMKPAALEVELPGTSDARAAEAELAPLRIQVGKDGNYALGNQSLQTPQALRAAVAQAAAGRPAEQLRAQVEADAAAPHQAVVTAMDALAAAGVARVSIATAGQPR